MGPVVALGSTPLYAVTVNVLVPTVVGYPLRLPSNSSSSSPSGRDPCDTVNSGAGCPDAANLKAYLVPTVAISSGFEAVKLGATSPAFTPMVIESVVTLGSTPLDAVTRNELKPDFVGVPDKTPSELNMSPSGSDPSDTSNVGAGKPDAAKAYE